MKTNKNNNNDNKINQEPAKLAILNDNLKREIFTFLKIEECFNTLYNCNKSFIKALKSPKIINLMLDIKEFEVNKPDPKQINSDSVKFFNKILDDCKSYFENFEEK